MNPVIRARILTVVISSLIGTSGVLLLLAVYGMIGDRTPADASKAPEVATEPKTADAQESADLATALSAYVATMPDALDRIHRGLDDDPAKGREWVDGQLAGQASAVNAALARLQAGYADGSIDRASYVEAFGKAAERLRGDRK